MSFCRARESVDVLIMDVNDPYEDFKLAAAHALGKQAPSADVAVPALATLLADEHRRMRYVAAVALAKMGDRGIDCVVGFVQNELSERRSEAIYALGGAGLSGR